MDDLVKELVLRLLTTPAVREALLAQGGEGYEGAIGRTLAELGAAQSRLQGLDDEFYVRGVLGEGRYRSVRVKLEKVLSSLQEAGFDRVDSFSSWTSMAPGGPDGPRIVAVGRGRPWVTDSGGPESAPA